MAGGEWHKQITNCASLAVVHGGGQHAGLHCGRPAAIHALRMALLSCRHEICLSGELRNLLGDEESRRIHAAYAILSRLEKARAD